MAHRYGGRLGANLENEQRRLQREPVYVWTKEWVVPQGSAALHKDVKVLKWVRTAEQIKFDQLQPEEEHFVGEETLAVMEVDDAASQAPVAATPPVAAEPVVAVDAEAAPGTQDVVHADAAVSEAAPSASVAQVLDAAEEKDGSSIAQAQPAETNAMDIEQGGILAAPAAPAHEAHPALDPLPSTDVVATGVDAAVSAAPAVPLGAILDSPVPVAPAAAVADEPAVKLNEDSIVAPVAAPAPTEAAVSLPTGVAALLDAPVSSEPAHEGA